MTPGLRMLKFEASSKVRSGLLTSSGLGLHFFTPPINHRNKRLNFLIPTKL